MTTNAVRHDVWSTPLTPLAFLGRAAEVFAEREAVVYGERRMTYAQLSEEVTRVARAAGLRCQTPVIGWRTSCPTSRRCSSPSLPCPWPEASWWR